MLKMERKNPRKSPVGGGATPAKVSRKRNKNGMSKVKEEKGGDGPSNSADLEGKGGLDEMMMNGSEIKLEQPGTPLDSKQECPPEIPPLPELGHPDFPDCKD